MNCCIKCFNDVEILDIVKNKGLEGNCDFCGSINVLIYDIDSDNTLSDMLSELLDIYTESTSLPKNFPKEKVDFLKNILHSKWAIFNVKPDCIYRLIIAICNEKYLERPNLFNEPIGILESYENEYLDEFSILRAYEWNDFIRDIKLVNRFHTNHINKKVLHQFLKCKVKMYKSGSVFYRARICADETGISKLNMGAPPREKATAGRINPTGISILYLADSIETTLHEIRAGTFDLVTVGKFKVKKDIEVIDFTSLDRINPFYANNVLGIDYTQYAINFDHLKLISKEIAKPLRRQDSELDYLPTQYISDYIKKQGFDGVEYISTIRDGGLNLAAFNNDLFECIETSVHRIKSIQYSEEKVS